MMNNNIKYTAYSLILAAMLSVTSCSDFLEVGPTNELPSSGAVTNVTEAQSSLNGAYIPLRHQRWYGVDMITYGDVRSEDMGPTKPGDRTNSQYTYGHLLALTSTNAGYFWEYGYWGLTRVNSLIAHIEGGSVAVATQKEQEDLDDIYGQALCLRALMHFDIVRIYGEPYLKDNTAPGVVIADRVIAKDEKPQRATVKETYDFIVGDLRKAAGLDGGKVLLKKEINASTKNAIFSYYAAEALLSRVYLYMGSWDASYTLAKDVIDNGPYSLISNANYAASWSSEFTTESIFEVWSSNTENADREGIGYVTRPGSGLGYGAVSATPQLISLMEEDPDDVRLTIMKPNVNNQAHAYVAKYPGRDGNVYVNNSRVIRLSDVYLIAAEAGLYAGKSDASKYLNDIRKRANPAVSDVTATAELIEKERRKELVGEGHRFFDIIRNLGTKTVERKGTQDHPINDKSMVMELGWNNDDTYLLILPIPQAEIDVNKDIKQNKGYPLTN